MDKKNFIEDYETPQVEILEVQVEQCILSASSEGFGEWQY
mgnify:CR=1 FL=1|jgi:hypothetical protein